MPKFKVGDECKVKYVRGGECAYWKPGAIVTITSIHSGITWGDDPYECVVRCINGQVATPLLEQLEPPVQLGDWEDIEEFVGWKRDEVKELEEVE